MGDEVVYDKQNKNQLVTTRKTKTGAEVDAAISKEAMQDASRLKPKKTGRGMLPGETIVQWKERLKKMDEEAAGTAGKQAEAMKSPPPK